MLTKEFKEEALKRLEQMSADDFIKLFEKIGSERVEEEVNNYLLIEKDLRNYGISEFSPYESVKDYNKQDAVYDDYDTNNLSYALAA